MSRTYRNAAGKKVRQKNEKKRKDKKFFGYTSGLHSRHTTTPGYVGVVGGKVVYEQSDQAPKKGKDFIKWGWPFDMRHKKHPSRKIA